MNKYKAFFGFNRIPFSQDVAVKNLMQTNQLLGVTERIKYAVELGSTAIITGDIGTGKSSALRYAVKEFHPSEYVPLFVTSTTGSVIELYKQICSELKIELKTHSKSLLIKTIKSYVQDYANKKQKLILFVDEASLLRIEVFAELHTLMQFDNDSHPQLPIILAGQNNLIDAMQYPPSRAFASRIVARSKLNSLKMKETTLYLEHHLTLCGCKQKIFSESAVTAIHQSSNGMLRKINNIARGSLIAACKQKSQVVEPDHVQMACSELF